MNGDVKQCEACGGSMSRPRWRNGKLDSSWKNRKYCSSKCYGKANEIAEPSIQTLRKRDQRRLKAEKCQECGSTENVHRHHAKDEVMILCQKCHTAEHMKDGTWGRQGSQMA